MFEQAPTKRGPDSRCANWKTRRRLTHTRKTVNNKKKVRNAQQKILITGRPFRHNARGTGHQTSKHIRQSRTTNK